MKAFASVGAATYPLLTQGEFLRAMGIDMRTQSLAHGLDGAARDNLVSATHRLMDEAGMGQLFKVAAVTQPGLAPPYPFGDA
jgi:SAM-dependent MidA family methyltransferase